MITLINDTITDNVVSEFQDALDKGIKIIQDVTNELNQDADKLSCLLREKFKEDGFDLRIEFNPMINLDTQDIEINNIDLNIKETIYSKTVNKKGVIAWGQRFWGGLFNRDWGTQQETHKTYTIHLTEMTKELNSLVNEELVTPLKAQICQEMNKLVVQTTSDIDNFGKQVTEIIDELKQSLEHQQTTVHQSKAEKEDEKQFISSLRQSHDDLDVDWQKLKEKFKVEDIKS